MRQGRRAAGRAGVLGLGEPLDAPLRGRAPQRDRHRPLPGIPPPGLQAPHVAPVSAPRDDRGRGPPARLRAGPPAARPGGRGRGAAGRGPRRSPHGTAIQLQGRGQRLLRRVHPLRRTLRVSLLRPGLQAAPSPCLLPPVAKVPGGAQRGGRHPAGAVGRGCADRLRQRLRGQNRGARVQQPECAMGGPPPADGDLQRGGAARGVREPALRGGAERDRGPAGPAKGGKGVRPARRPLPSRGPRVLAAAGGPSGPARGPAASAPWDKDGPGGRDFVRAPERQGLPPVLQRTLLQPGRGRGPAARPAASGGRPGAGAGPVQHGHHGRRRQRLHPRPSEGEGADVRGQEPAGEPGPCHDPAGCR